MSSKIDEKHPIVRAAMFGDLDALMQLEPTAEQLNEPFSMGDSKAYQDVTVLMIVAASPWADAAALRWVLDRGADLKIKSKMGTTAIWYAATVVLAALIEQLHPRGGDRSYRAGDPARIQVLLDAGANPNDSSPRGLNVLGEAARRGCVECVRLLLARGAKVYPRNRPSAKALAGEARCQYRLSNLPLFLAVETGSIECVRLLLDAGASARIITQDEYSILDKAADIEMVELLMAHGATFDSPLRGWKATGVETLLRNGRYEVARLLLERGADPEPSEYCVNLAHFCGGMLHDLKALKLLEEFGADIWKRDAGGRTILHTVCWPAGNGREVLEYLIARGIPIDERDNHGQTALHVAVFGDFGSTIAVETLAKHGADLNVADNEGRTALMVAAQWGELECYELLLGHGADPTLRDQRGMTAADYLDEDAQ